MSDDILRQYIRPIDEPEPHEPSLVRGDSPPRLEIHELDGNARSFPYLALQLASFNPSVGIRLVCGDVAITLRGLNLRPLYQALHAQVAKSILVFDDDVNAPNGEAVVTACSFETIKPGGSIC